MALESTQSESIIVRLDAKPSEVNAEAVATSMTAVLALISEAKQELAGNQQLLVKSRPFADGSFEIPLDLIAIVGGAMFASSPLIENVLDILRKYFDVRRLLRGEALTATPEEPTVSINGKDITIGQITLNLLQPSSKANQEVERAMEQVEADENIKQFQILQGPDRRPLVTVARSEFKYFMRRSVPTTLPLELDITVRETLTIISPVFQGRGHWKFNRNGTSIKALIADDVFLTRVKSAEENFSAGDRLDVTLVVHQKLDETTKAYENKKFIVHRVWGHTKRDEQSSLLDG